MEDFIMKYWFEVTFGLIASGLRMGFKTLLVQFRAFKLGMQAMLRKEIIDKYNKHMDMGYIPIYAFENITAMYTQYHALGGYHCFSILKKFF